MENRAKRKSGMTGKVRCGSETEDQEKRGRLIDREEQDITGRCSHTV